MLSARLPIVLLSIGSLFSGAGLVFAEPVWTRIDNRDELRTLVAGRFLLMSTTRTLFHREDGKMIEYFAESDSYTVRKWTLDEDGKLCWSIHLKSDQVADCAYIEKSDAEPVRYRYHWIDPGSKQPLEFAEGTREDIVDALNKAAGPSQSE